MLSKRDMKVWKLRHEEVKPMKSLPYSLVEWMSIGAPFAYLDTALMHILHTHTGGRISDYNYHRFPEMWHGNR